MPELEAPVAVPGQGPPPVRRERHVPDQRVLQRRDAAAVAERPQAGARAAPGRQRKRAVTAQRERGDTLGAAAVLLQRAPRPDLERGPAASAPGDGAPALD